MEVMGGAWSGVKGQMEVVGQCNVLCLLCLGCAESFPVEVCSSAPGPSPPAGQCTLRISPSELQLVASSGEVVCRWAVEGLNQVAMEAEGETGVSQVILSGTSLG